MPKFKVQGGVLEDIAVKIQQNVVLYRCMAL